MPPTDVERLEASIAYNQELVALRDKYRKLTSNREFRAIIEEHYFQKEAIRLTGLIGAPAPDKVRAEVILELQAISKLQQFFRTIEMSGDQAEEEIATDQAELSEILNEEVA